MRHDADHDGWPSPEEPGIPEMLVSDGYGFVTTDANGHYTLELNEKAKTVYVQRTDQYTADVTRFWHRLTPGRQEYDFLLTDARPVIGDTLDIVFVGDSETGSLDYMLEPRRYLLNHPEVDLFVHAGDICNQSPLGMEMAREFINAAILGRTVVYACGNHDVDFRGKGFYGDHDPFLALLGPWWESFELGGCLFVVVPIYNSWGRPILYDMLDCGDWLRELCRLYPDKKKILIGHDLPDLVGYRIPSHSGDVVLDDEQFVCAIYGHKHMNIVKKYPSGRKAFCVAAPNKGGAGCFAPSFRVVHLDRATDQAYSELFFCNVRDRLKLITPNGQFRLEGAEGPTITVDAYSGGDEVTAVTATVSGNVPVNLERTSIVGWSAPTAWKLPEKCRVTLTARLRSGRELSRDFKVSTEMPNRLEWVAQLPAEVAMCDLQLVNGLLVIGCADDANAEKGGLYALDPTSGRLVWHYATGYGIRNNFATDGSRIYALDTRANIHAVDATTGLPCWVNPSDPAIVNPAASAIVCQDGIVVGGYGRHLRGIRAEDGMTLWRNTAWQVEERTPAEDKLAVDGDSVFVLSRLNGLYCHDLRTGAVRWQYKTLFANATALPDGNSVWLVGDGSKLLRLDQATGKLLEEIKSFPCHGASGALAKLGNGLLLVSSSHKGLGAFDPVAGKERWRFTPNPAVTPTADYATGNPSSVAATPLVDGGLLYVAGNDGCLYQLDPLDGKVIEAFTVGMHITSRPCADARFIYVADACGRVMSIAK